MLFFFLNPKSQGNSSALVLLVPWDYRREKTHFTLGVPDFYNESEIVGDGEAHCEQAHLNSGSNGIALWPQLSHCNQLCADHHRANFVPDAAIAASDDWFSEVLHQGISSWKGMRDFARCWNEPREGFHEDPRVRHNDRVSKKQ
jgi:hypothetical protein